MAVDVGRYGSAEERRGEGRVVELERRYPWRADRGDGAANPRPTQILDEDVTVTISAIRAAASALNEAQDQRSRLEDLLDEQGRVLQALQQQKQEAHAELAAADRALRAERDRAERAEGRAASADGRLRQVEEQNASLKAQLAGLVTEVRNSLGGLPDRERAAAKSAG